MKVIGYIGDYNKSRRTFHVEKEYFDCLSEYNITPIIIPFHNNEYSIQQYIDMCDGFIFIGGNDVNPLMYGEDKIKECGNTEILVDIFSINIIKNLYRQDKPTLGICRGHQIINVALGGTLYQDIFSQYETKIDHRPEGYTWDLVHNVENVKGTIFEDIFGKEKFAVNSIHHQAIKKISSKLKIGQMSSDGIVEGFYAPDKKFFVGVQWHPEKCSDDMLQKKQLFKSFVDSL